MSIKSSAAIYKILEDALRSTDTPLTCVDLYDLTAVKKHAENANKVSDYLGHMWRRGLLQRYYAPAGSSAKARFAYTWIETEEGAEPVPIPSNPVERLTFVKNGHTKPNVTITEADDEIVLDFEQFTITIHRKA